jgi:hypothetical protein
MNTYLHNLESRPKARLVIELLLLVVAVSAIDYYAGVELSFSALYLFPVAFGAWYIGRRTGVFISIVCATSLFALSVHSTDTVLGASAILSGRQSGLV